MLTNKNISRTYNILNSDEDDIYNDRNLKRLPERGNVHLTNPYLHNFQQDSLYHLGILSQNSLIDRFHNIKFVIMGGSANRAKELAERLHKIIKPKEPLEDLAQSADRFKMYQIGPVLCVNHGMGVPSLSILLHELFKMLFYAKCTNVTFIRAGTCGLIDKKPGTIVISENSLNEKLKPCFEQIKLGKIYELECVGDKDVINDFMEVKMKSKKCEHLIIEKGLTLTTNDFYEGQGRLNGAFCDYSSNESHKYLLLLKSLNVINIEMEANCFLALCRKANLHYANVDVGILNRLESDQVDISYKKYISDLLDLMTEYIKFKLNIQ